MTKQDVLNTWLTYAQADLDAAERLLKSPNPNNWTFLLSAWHCHQAIEKILKMVIIGQGKENTRKYLIENPKVLSKVEKLAIAAAQVKET